MESKTAQVRRLVASGDYKEALQICKDWVFSDSRYSKTLRRGYECLLYPEFYKQIGFDPQIEYQKAVRLLHKIYDSK